jgi:TldD protein
MTDDLHDAAALLDAVATAARELPAGDPRAHVFYEAREDRRWRVGSDGSREASVSRSRGAAIVATQSLHATDPHPDDLPALAREAAGGSPSRPSPWERAGAEDVADPRETGDRLARLLSAGLTRARPAQRLIAEIRLTESVQKIWVCRRDGEARADIRRNGRIEVRVSSSGSAGTGRAIEERALEPGGIPSGEIVDRAISRAVTRAGAKPRADGWTRTAAVFAPAVAGIVVHELIGHALEGDVVAAGRSHLVGGPASVVIPRSVRVVDDPTRGRAPWTIDDEGTASRPVVLVEDGRVAGLLHDLTTALTSAAEPTGHGRRGSYLDGVLPRMGCTYLEGGDEDPRAIVSRTTRGIYIRRIASADTIPRIGRGTFIVTDADWIDGGALGEPLRPFPIVIDAEETLRTLDAIGSDLAFDHCIGSCVRDGQPVATSVGAPTIRLGVIRAFFEKKN